MDLIAKTPVTKRQLVTARGVGQKHDSRPEKVERTAWDFILLLRAVHGLKLGAVYF